MDNPQEIVNLNKSIEGVDLVERLYALYAALESRAKSYRPLPLPQQHEIVSQQMWDSWDGNGIPPWRQYQ